ncbi:uncharacterized protein [Battus philenor]|uniref:uncharacterized protein n=1 Tax=Battus philenor TaxID=42288 RepID=UPI0035D0A0D8
MYAFILFGLLACAYAAPHYHGHGFHHRAPMIDFGFHDHFDHVRPYFQDDIFDTRKFWMDLSREMAMFDQMLTDFTKRFPTSVSSEGFDEKTGEYIVTIPLTGFEEKDIVVKAREGVLMVQAVQKMNGVDQRTYLDVRTLPERLNVTGSWTYDKDILKIVFPPLTKPEEGETTTEITTDLPSLFQPESREEVDKQDQDNKDADVGVERGDLDKQNELNTNEIPNKEIVEATTYAVDLKDEVEFVPVRY